MGRTLHYLQQNIRPKLKDICLYLIFQLKRKTKNSLTNKVCLYAHDVMPIYCSLKKPQPSSHAYFYFRIARAGVNSGISLVHSLVILICANTGVQSVPQHSPVDIGAPHSQCQTGNFPSGILMHLIIAPLYNAVITLWNQSPVGDGIINSQQ